MGRMNELAEAAAELRHCGEALIGVSETLKKLFSGPDTDTGEKTEQISVQASDVSETEKKEDRTVTKEEVRKLLGIRLKEGFKEQIQELFRKYGGEKLKDIDPSHYADLLKDAEGLKDA